MSERINAKLLEWSTVLRKRTVAARVADFVLWLFGPLDAYLAKLSLARLQSFFDVNGPITWRDLSPFSPVRPPEGAPREP